MNFFVNAALSLLIGVPAAIGWIRLRRIDRSYLPLIVLLTLGFASEVTRLVFIYKSGLNALNFNLFSLVESVLLLWQFYRWKIIRRRWVFYLLQGLLLATWVWDSFWNSNLWTYNSVHLIAYSSVIVIFSIDTMNRAAFAHPTPLLKNAEFLIGLGLFVFCLYTTVVEIFWQYGLNDQSHFRIQVLSIMPYINFFANLVFTLALLWAPVNFRYIMQL